MLKMGWSSGENTGMTLVSQPLLLSCLAYLVPCLREI